MPNPSLPPVVAELLADYRQCGQGTVTHRRERAAAVEALVLALVKALQVAEDDGTTAQRTRIAVDGALALARRPA